MEAQAPVDGGSDDALVFIGFMGAGKSLAARSAAAELNVAAVDSDALLEKRLGASIEQYFASHGEGAFREQEEEAVSELLEAPPAPVISLGGGAVGSERVREALARHTVVLLDVDADTAWQRARGGRPLARDRDRFVALHAERAPRYAELADAILPAGRRDEVRHALPAIRALAQAPPQTKLVWAGDYPVYVGDGLVGGRLWPLDGRRFLVTDSTVGEHYAWRLPAPELEVRIEPGERHKTLQGAERVLRALAAAGMDGDDHVIALGGGVVGDLAGFCAAVYQRGVRVVQVPTTLVGLVDSAYGGKTGVDLPEGKNYVGAYHQPAAVLADPATLATLPPAELGAGWAEVVKTALIAGGELWKRVRARPAPAFDRDLVLACARVKLRIVAEDERDAGARQALNLGHTVGHAVETATGYARYRHGEAVGLGLLAALTLSGQPELRDEVAELLSANGLPTRLDAGIDREAVTAAVQRDKKRRGGRVGFVLLDEPGEPRTGCAVAEDELRAALEKLAR
ncbi:MAG TPA: bifunctional shikimate kinase/3-dehydroquinate synthase [Solirubrobacteraceae bacterium]|nr:bifunctional shikimate kinase/3-dehydroquinate synthase [Solirubrobacteraceae bacterium]